jgi:hypothetical protein
MSMAEKVVPLREGEKLNGALAFIRQGVAVFPLWWPEDGRCTCGNPSCKSAGKHPIGKLVPNGFKNASTDEATIKRWWTTYAKANIGIATGRVSGIAVVDVDGPKGEAKLAALLSEYEQILEPKNYVETGRLDGGQHYYFKYPTNTHVPSHKDDGLEVKSDGGYVVAPPSRHVSGKTYTWKNVGPLEELSKCFVDFAIQKRKLSSTGNQARARAGSSKKRLENHLAASYSPPEWSEAEEARIRSALTVIPAEDREIWFEIGAALHSTGWGGRARALFDQWSEKPDKYNEEKSDKYNEEGQDKLWESFARGYEGRPITLGTLFALAKKHGWEEPPPSEIAELNEKHFLIRNIGGKCLVGEMVPNHAGSGQMLSLQSIDAFRSWYANQTARGSNKPISVGAYWLVHPRRRGYQGVDLVPNAPKELPNGNLNLWRGFGVESKAGDWSRMRNHILNVLAGGDYKAACYILCWAAWCVQHPGERAEVALVLQGGKGSGKGVFLRALARCFGEHGMQITNEEHLIGRFNGHFRSCLFLFADEAFWAGNKKGESVLKGLITEPILMIEQKGIDAVQWPNRLHIAMAANSDWVVPASPGERRYAVFMSSDKYVRGNASDAEHEAYFKALHHELENGGLEAMLFDLLKLPLGSWHPRQVYETEGLQRQKEHSLSPLEQWLEQVLQEGRLPNDLTGRKDFALTRSLVEDAKMRIGRLSGYLSDKAMGTFLRKHGCIKRKEPCCGAGELRGWRFPPLTDMRAEWSRKFGGWPWDDPKQQDWE